jgi:hypothetical protein
MGISAEDGGKARVSEGERVVKMSGRITVGQGGYLHQASRAINAAETRRRT